MLVGDVAGEGDGGEGGGQGDVGGGGVGEEVEVRADVLGEGRLELVEVRVEVAAHEDELFGCGGEGWVEADGGGDVGEGALWEG